MIRMFRWLLGGVALLLAAGVASADTPPTKLQTVTYSVADLITPIDNYTLPVAKLWKQQHPDEEFAPAYQMLMNLITSTIAEDSWSTGGGKGTIQYYPQGFALVVKQTSDVQQQIADFLHSLGTMMREVSVECKLVKMNKHGRLHETPLPKITFLVEQEEVAIKSNGTRVYLGIGTKAIDDGTVQMVLVYEKEWPAKGAFGNGDDYYTARNLMEVTTCRNVKAGQTISVPLDPVLPEAKQRHWLVLTLRDVPQEDETELLDNLPRVPR
jgi:hypothetical protein